MGDEDRRYYEKRVEEELDHAQLSTEITVVRAHCHLAGLYLDKLFGQLVPAAAVGE